MICSLRKARGSCSAQNTISNDCWCGCVAVKLNYLGFGQQLALQVTAGFCCLQSSLISVWVWVY